MPAIALALVVAKAGCFVLGSLIHEASELMKRFGEHHDDTARAWNLLIKDEQFSLQETTNESSSNSLILYASREVVLSSSSRELAILTNDAPARETPFNAFETNSLSIMKSFNFFAAWAWFRARFIALMQSAFRSVITDMKMAMSSSIASASESESIVEKKAVASIAFLIPASSSKLLAQAILILKESTLLIKSRCERNMSTLLRHIFPTEVGGTDICFDLLPNSNSIGDIISGDVGTWTQRYNGMVYTCLEIFSSYFTSLLRPLLLRLHGPKAMALVLLFCGSISFIGWSIPLMIFEGFKPDQGFLQKLLVPKATSELEVGAFGSIRPQFAFVSDGTSNAFNLMGSAGNFDDLHSASISMAMGANDGQVHLNCLGLADFTPSLHLWPAEEFSFSTTSVLDFQTNFLWGDEATAASFDWNMNAIDSTDGFRTALESRLFIFVLEVPNEDRVSIGIATEHFDGYSLSAIIDEVFVLGFNSQALQDLSSKKLELGYYSSTSSSVFDGLPSTTPTMVFIGVGAGPPQPQELSTVNFLSRECDDGYTGPVHVDDRYSDLMGLQTHETHAGLDHPGLFMLLWTHNNLIAAASSHRQTGYFWEHKAAASLPLGWNIEVSHCIQSESPLFVCVLGDLSSDRFDTSQFALVVAETRDDCTASAITHETLTFTPSFVVQAPQNQYSVESESLGRYILSKSVSDGNTLSMQMIVAELGASGDISPIQCRDVDRSTASDAALACPLLRLPAGSSKRFSAPAQPSLGFGVLEEYTSRDIFRELRQLAWILLMLAYCNSDGATDELENVALSSDSELEVSPDTNLDLELCDDEIIFADEDPENRADEAIMRNTNVKPSRHEVIALRSELGRHWKSPSKRRVRRTSRYRSRPKYFETTWV